MRSILNGRPAIDGLIRLWWLWLLLAPVFVIAACSGDTPGGAGTSSGAPGTAENPGTENSGTGEEYGHDRPKPDPVAMNGPIFKDWPTPKLAIVMSAQQQGYLEPCGCAGLENQKGGLARRHTFLEQLRSQNWPVIALDAGAMIGRQGRQAEIKFEKSLNAYLGIMQYDAILLGGADFQQPATTILASVTNVEAAPKHIVCANVGLFDFATSQDVGTTVPSMIIERGGMKIGVVGVVGKSSLDAFSNPELETCSPEEALGKVLPELAEATDHIVLLAHATQAECKQYAVDFPQIDTVLTSDGADVPPAEPVDIEGAPGKLIEVGHKGMYCGVLAFFDDEKTPVRFQRVPLDHRFSDSPAMVEVMEKYQQELKVIYENQGYDGLEIARQVHPKASIAGDAEVGLFAGSASCQECHPTAFDIWAKSKHAHATDTLIKLNPQRQFDPECLSCHATGWNPQEYAPFEGGFADMNATPALAQNGCENCHGPSGGHVAAERGKDLVRKNEQRALIKQTKATVEHTNCRVCHDPDNSPDFKFDMYWPKVEHKGKR